jgi:hypothetical protein
LWRISVHTSFVLWTNSIHTETCETFLCSTIS